MISLRPATPGDAGLLRELRNDPEVRRQSWQTAEVQADEHAAWLARKLADVGCRLYLIVEREPIGQLRLDRRNSEEAELSIALLPRYRGRGLGRASIELGCRTARAELGVAVVVAEIRTGNAASRAAFAAAGFVETAADDERVVMVERSA